MSGGGGSRPGPTQQVVQTNELPGFLEEPLKLAAGEAQNVYKSGVGSSPYPGATYVPPGQDEMQGMAQIRELATAGNPLVAGSMQQMGGLLGGRGISGDHMDALRPMKDIASGQNRITVGDFEAGGGEQFNKALDIASDRTMQGVNAQMASMGRLGSDAHQGMASREIGELQTAARADQLNKDRQLQLQAQGANIANQGQTAGMLADQFGSGRDAMLRGMALSPALDQMRYSGARNLIDVGAAQRGELQDENEANQARFQAEQMQPWGQIGLLTSALQGFPDMSTVTSNTSGTVPQGSRISGLLGGAAMGAGTGAKMGSIGGIPGAALGGLLGGGLGLFM